MSKVYITLCYWDFEGSTVQGVFDSLDKANNYAKKLSEESFKGMEDEVTFTNREDGTHSYRAYAEEYEVIIEKLL